MKSILHRSALFLGAACIAGMLPAQTGNIGVNNTGAAPDPTAILDVSSNYLAPATQKGFLIPRMSLAQRNAIPAPANGLTIYQTTAPAGLYFYDAVSAAWVRLSTGGGAWGLTGNGATNPVQDFLGTTDNQALVFRTNALERMRLDTDGDLGVGTAAPLERLDIVGAIKLTGTSATNTLGTIRWNGVGQHHEGNIDGTVNGWRKLQNVMIEEIAQAYNQAGTPTCANGSVTLGDQNGVGTNGFIAPYWQAGTSQRVRHQYLYHADELNVQLNQLFNDPNATEGLCANQPINSIAFYTTGASGLGKIYLQCAVTIKHTTLNALSGGFDNTADPASQCYLGGGITYPQTSPGPGVPAAAGWDTYTFGAPFLWNGVDNIIIEYCYSAAGGNFPNPEIWQTNFLGFDATYTRGGAATAPGCSNVGGCGGAVGGCGMTNACGTGGAYQNRPVIQFNGTVATAPPATAGSGNFLRYNGGFMVEQNGGWSGNPYNYKGPGTISAENGVYTDQVLLNDHVFDRYFDGRVQPEDAATFGQLGHLGMDDMYNYVERNRHLPTMKGRSEWDAEGGFSLGDLTNQLWRTTETHALYLTELKDRADLLTLLTTDQVLTATEFERLRTRVVGLEGYNEQEKRALIEDLEGRVITTTELR